MTSSADSDMLSIESETELRNRIQKLTPLRIDIEPHEPSNAEGSYKFAFRAPLRSNSTQDQPDQAIDGHVTESEAESDNDSGFVLKPSIVTTASQPQLQEPPSPLLLPQQASRPNSVYFLSKPAEFKRSYSDSNVSRLSTVANGDKTKKAYPFRLHHNDPRDWMPGFTAVGHFGHSSIPSAMAPSPFLGPSPLFATNSFVDPKWEETAEVLGVESPYEAKHALRQKGISQWAAAMAVGGSAINLTILDHQVEGESTEPESGHPEAIAVETSGGLPNRLSKATSLGGWKRKRSPSVKSKPVAVEVSPEDIEENNMKRTFILKLAKRFYQYGAPSHRFEHHLTQVAEALKVEAEFILLPALIMVSFGGENYKSNTHFIKVSGGINMAKLAQVNALCLTLTQGLIDVENAMDLLEGIRVANDYSWWQVLLTYPVSSFTIGLLLFRLSWLESSIAGGLGLVVGTMSLAADKHTGFVFLLEFVGSLVVSFTSRALQGILHNVCFDYVKVALAALAVFLPGLSLTISIIELSTRNMVSGTVRLFSALFIAMLLGFGMTIGSALVLWETSAPTNPTCEPPSLYWAFLFFLPMAMATNISFQGSKHQWAVMTLAAALGFVFNTLLNLIPGLAAQPTAVTALSAISIGLTGNIYARITNDVAVAPILAGILLQVPGGLGVKSTLGFFAGVTEGSSANIVNGVNFTFQMLTIAMSLAMGLFVATLMVWPIRGPKSKYLTI